MQPVIRRGDERFRTTAPGIETLHCFSFGRHYDPAHVGHGPLVACDEHRLAAGAGFPPHPHRDLEVVTWVLEGALTHEGPAGEVVVPAGAVQRMSAGSGVVHSEVAAGAATRFVQSWLLPARAGAEPSYDWASVPRQDGLVAAASGLGHPGAVALGSPAALHVARLGAGQRVRLPGSPRLHLLVLRGQVEVSSAGSLGPGDSVRLWDALDVSLAAPRAGADEVEALVWQL